jgi:outer membrane lipoprotein SlyB
MWAAGIALVLFCGAGIAAMMGWMPLPMSRPPDVPAGMERVPATKMGPAQPNGAPRARSSYEPRSEPVMGPSAARVPMKCTDCGVIESTREVSARAETSGLGAIGGAVVGGVLGNQVGSGRGQEIATVVGAVGGVIAGNEIEKRVLATKTYEITVRLDDGSVRVLNQAAAPSWRSGDRIRIVEGAIQAP